MHAHVHIHMTQPYTHIYITLYHHRHQRNMKTLLNHLVVRIPWGYMGITCVARSIILYNLDIAKYLMWIIYIVMYILNTPIIHTKNFQKDLPSTT